jgi:mono/diheme cytochrome c family protein
MGRWLALMLGLSTVLWLCGLPVGTTQAAEQPANDAATHNKGIGPIKEVKLGPLDQALAEKGQGIFEEKCSACHKIEERYVGPALKGVTQRRTPEWIMNMALNPQEMIMEDPIAQELLAEYFTPMAFQNVTEDDVRAILEYFRSVDQAEASEQTNK